MTIVMKSTLSKKTMRQCFYSRNKVVALLLCILGFVTSMPIHAQKKPVNGAQRSVSSSVPSGYTRVGNTMLYYRQLSSSIDIQGCYNNRYYGSTYSNNGYKVAMQVNNGSAQSVNCLQGTTTQGVTFFASIEQQGELARICYNVTNNNEEDVIVSLGTHADVMIGNNDRAPISKRIDTAGNSYGVTMKDGNGAQLCVLFGSGLAGVTSVSDYWFGYYYTNNSSYEMVGNYSEGDYYMRENGSYDSGMGWCWKNRTIPAGETVVFSYLIGVGEVNLEPNSSFEVTPDDPEGWNDLSRPHKLTLEGLYESPAGLDGMIEYAVEDSEEWLQLTEMMPSGSTFSDTLVAMFDATREKHIIRFRTRDNVGNTTLLPSIEYIDVSFHEYSGIIDKTYTGDSIYQEVSCVDVEDLQISTGRYSNNVNAGIATFYVEGVFPYTIGRKAYTFHINPLHLTGDIELSSNSFVFNGQEHIPSWVFTNESYAVLEEGKDYNVSYIDNIYPGTAKVLVAGKGNYTAELEETFFIDKAQLRDDLYSITLPNEDISYDENEHKAIATVATGVGEVKFTYTTHGESNILENAPIDEGHYDIYCEIADGDWYYGKTKEYIGSFAIYRFDESEWQSLGVLYAELQQMNVPLSWNMTGGIKNVGSFEGLIIEKGHVLGVSFANKGMTGVFPSSLMAFTQLKNIDISNNNLTGDIATAITAIKMQNQNAFNSLKTLDISNNQLKGNIGVLAKCMSNLTSLNASNNKFEDLFPALPSSITNLDISNQKMDKIIELNISNLSLDDISTSIPTILLYDQLNRTYKNSISLLCTKADLETFNKYDTNEWAMQLQFADNQLSIPYISTQNAYYGDSGDTLNVLNMTDIDNTDGCSFRIALSFNQGDANFVNGVNTADLQTTILYAFGEYSNYPFNFTAANNYIDGLINVQDVIRMVDILLNTDITTLDSTEANKMIARATSISHIEAEIVAENNQIRLISTQPIAALRIQTSGEVQWNMNELGLEQSVKDNMIVGYSLIGNNIPAGETLLGTYQGNVSIKAAELSDEEAQIVPVTFDNQRVPSGIDMLENNNDVEAIYDVLGRKYGSMNHDGLYIIKPNNQYIKVYNNK